MIILKEAKTKKEMRQFVTFPFSLYKKNKYWVPPIIKDEIASFDKTKNPVFKHATANYFLAYKKDKIVGRIAAIVNHLEIDKQGIKKMRFGWYDTIDDLEVSKTLLNKVKEIGRKNNLEYIEGPVGFSNLDKVGLLTKGYDHIGTMITWYNYPYYVEHLKQLGFNVEKSYHETKIEIASIDSSTFKRITPIIKKRYQVKSINFSNTKEIFPYIDEMFELFNNTYNTLDTFVPITKDQIAHYKKKFIPFINPEYIKFVLDKNDKIIAFSIIMPAFASALQKAKGKLFPFGIYHLLKAKKTSKNVIAYLIGVHPDYQNKGITAIIFDEFYKTVTKKGIKQLIRTPELTNNMATAQIWKRMEQNNHKNRSTYRLDL